MAFTEKYCDFTNGSNLNSGSTTAGSATYTSAAGDSDGTSVFTPNDGSTPASTVSVGDFGSVYVTAGATVAAFTGRITTVAAGVNGAVTFSTTAKSGAFPAASAGAHTITLKVGGAWKGPNSAVGFPFGFINGAETNVAGDAVRVNLLNTATYAVTAAISHNVAGPVQFEGYTSSAGDGGRFLLDGGTSGASYNLLTFTNAATGCGIKHAILDHNGSTGSSGGLIFQAPTNAGNYAQDVIVRNMKGLGISATGANLDEFEIHACMGGNPVSSGALVLLLGAHAENGFVHDNAGSNAVGVRMGSPSSLRNCVVDTNGASGIEITAANIYELDGVDVYGNGANGVLISAASGAVVLTMKNCNLVLNGTAGTVYGVNRTGAGALVGRMANCGFGKGTQANRSGDTNNLGSLEVVGSVAYANDVTPWQDPANGDFRIVLGAAKAAGRGTFVQTAASYAGTVAYPDIGAAQSRGGGGPVVGCGFIRGRQS